MRNELTEVYCLLTCVIKAEVGGSTFLFVGTAVPIFAKISFTDQDCIFCVLNV